MKSSMIDRLTKEELDIQTKLQSKQRIHFIIIILFSLIIGIILGYVWKTYHEQQSTINMINIPTDYQPIDLTAINPKLIGQINGYRSACMDYNQVKGNIN